MCVRLAAVGGAPGIRPRQNAGMVESAKGSCPECHNSLVAQGLGSPWCPSCEWNLGAYDPALEPPAGWRSIARWGHNRAFRLDEQLALEARENPDALASTRTNSVLAIVSAVVVGGCLILVVTGIWLAFCMGFGANTYLGLLLLVIAFAFRPRFGKKPPKRSRVPREALPDLWTVVDDVAKAVGTEAVDVICLNMEMNASVARFGISGKRKLTIGIPLWLVLEPEMRVSLLAHEFGHFVNGDPRRSALAEPALSAISRLVTVSGGRRTLERINDRADTASPFEVLTQLLLWVVSRPFVLIELLVLSAALRDHQRAEYAADLTAARIAGRESTIALLDRLTIGDDVDSIMFYSAEQYGPLAWAGRVAAFQESLVSTIELRRQATYRATGLWESHPPSGRRAQLVAAQASNVPVLEISPEQWTRIDAGLAGWYQETHRQILGTREYLPRTPPQTPTG